MEDKPCRLLALRWFALRRLSSVLWLLTLSAHGQDFTYVTNAGGTNLNITGYTGPGGDVVIPGEVTGLPVTGIGNSAFRAISSLTNVTIPNSVITIGGSAFQACTNLASVIIPDSVTSISGYAFYSCTSLTNIIIPNSVSSIGIVAFDSCTSLTSITVDVANLSYSSDVAGVLFNKPQTTLIQCPGGKTGSYTIPNSVTGIGYSAFSSCASLTSITIPNSVTSIGGSAFSSCVGLTSITIPNSATNIGPQAFSGCTNMIAITVGPSNPAFSGLDGVLFNKNQTTLIACPAGFSGSYAVPSGVTNIGNYSFEVCASLTSVTIGTNVISIGISAFQSCSSLPSITIPNSVTSIGSSAFQFCSRLTNATIGTKVTTIGSSAFNSCSSLPSITIPNSVTSIGNYSFQSCSNLTSVSIGTKVTTIGSYAFNSCSSLAGITIPSSVTYIGSYVFYRCDSLTGITIPASVTIIGDSAFRSCTSLVAITVDALNPNYSSVGGALYNKSKTVLLQCPGGIAGEYIVPNTVTNIGNYVFDGCSVLSYVKFKGSTPNFGTDPFIGSTNVTVFYIPGTTGWGLTFAGRPTAAWLPQIQTDSTEFGFLSNQFGFNVLWTSGMTVVIEAATNLTAPTWTPLQAKTLTSDSAYFSDSKWTNYPTRYYRVRFP